MKRQNNFSVAGWALAVQPWGQHWGGNKYHHLCDVDDNDIDDDGVDIGGGHCDPGDIFELMKHCWMSSLHSGCYKYTFGNINK